MATVGILAHLLNRGRGYRSAGISRHSANLLEALARLDGTDRFVAFVGPTGAPPDPCPAGTGRLRYRVTGLPTNRPPARIGWEQLVAPVEAARGRLDLLHGLAYAVPRLAPCPTVVTVHDLSFLRFPELFRGPNRLYLGAVTRMSVARARKVIAVSGSTKRELVELLGVPPERVEVIPNGLEPHFRPLPHDEVERFRRARGLPERFVLHVGTLEPRKNVPLLVGAYARLRRRGLPHALVLAGGRGWLYDAIFAEVKARGLAEDVLFPGFIPEGEQPLWYNAAAAFAYPSVYEGFGLPPLESMACGTPVVVANSSSLPEVVGEAGLTVDPGDEAGLAEALGRLIEDGALRDRLRGAGLERAKLFDWNDVARRTVAVYRRVAEG
ncbi:MAG TPA: glycosyltransferase family 1 protein [Chloroflexota bacterium]